MISIKEDTQREVKRWGGVWDLGFMISKRAYQASLDYVFVNQKVKIKDYKEVILIGSEHECYTDDESTYDEIMSASEIDSLWCGFLPGGDASLYSSEGYGVELRTLPMDLESYKMFMDNSFADIIGSFFTNSRCGLHFHLSRGVVMGDKIQVMRFTEDRIKRMLLALAKPSKFYWLSYSSIIEQLFKRRPNDYAVSYDVVNVLSAMRGKELGPSKAFMGTRYVMVNTSPFPTVELRIPAATTCYEEFKEILTIIEDLLEFTNEERNEKIVNYNLLSFLRYLWTKRGIKIYYDDFDRWERELIEEKVYSADRGES
jgi:hypothetical protein